MIFRLIKFVWAVSLVAALASLLYVYASLSEEVIYSMDTTLIDEGKVLSRESFFYVCLGFLAGLNFLLYALSKNMRYRMEAMNTLLKNWQLSLAVVINVLFIIIVNFLQVVNSGESFNYDYLGYLIYVGLGLVLLWILALPILMIRTASLNK